MPDSGQAATQFVLSASPEVTRASSDLPQQVGQVVEAIHQQMADAVLALQNAVGDDGEALGWHSNVPQVRIKDGASHCKEG